MRLKVRRSTLQRWARFPRYIYVRFLRLYGAPEENARGVAIGIFVAMTPTSPFQMIIAVALASLLKGNQFMAAILTWVTNPITWPPIYGAAYWIGRLFLKAPPLRDVLQEELGLLQTWLKMGWQFFGCMMLGGVILGIICGLLGYYLTTPLYKILRERRQKKIRRRQLRAKKVK